MSSSRLHSRLPLKLTGLQTTPVALLLMPCESGGDIASGEATGDQFDPSKSESPTKLWRLCPWPESKLTCPSPTPGARGPPRLHTNRRRGAIQHARDSSFARQTGKAQAVPFTFLLSISYIYIHRRNRKERRHYQAYSLSSYRRQWNPCHMDFGLVPASH